MTCTAGVFESAPIPTDATCVILVANQSHHAPMQGLHELKTQAKPKGGVVARKKGLGLLQAALELRLVIGVRVVLVVTGRGVRIELRLRNADLSENMYTTA
jgi:hypothetical protein